MCRKHDECASGLCEPNDTPGGMNRCLLPQDVYVVNGRASSCTSADGSTAKPFCTLQEALNRIPSRYAIRLMGASGGTTTYAVAYTFSDYQTARIFGGGPANPDLDRPVITGGVNDLLFNAVGMSINIILDGIEIRGGRQVLYCYQSAGKSSVSIQRSDVSLANYLGIVASGCELTLNRSLIHDIPQGALIVDNSKYTITNNFIYRNGGQTNPLDSPIVLKGYGVFAHNTVVANIGGNSMQNTILCAGSSLIQASIIYPDPASTPMRSQFSGGCMLDKVVVHSYDGAIAGSIVKTPVFGSIPPIPYALIADTKNDDCCVDKITNSLAPFDYYGRPRPIGAAADIGAQELK